MKNQKFSDARSLCKQATKEAKSTPEDRIRRAKALLLCGDIEMKAKKYRAAIAHYKKAGHQAVGDKPLRKKALQGRRMAIAKKTKKAPRGDFIGELLYADLELYRASMGRVIKGGLLKSVLTQLDKAESLYRKDKDWHSVTWTKASRALVKVRGGLVDDGLREAERLVRRKIPIFAEVTATDAIQYGRYEKDDIDLAAKVAVWHNHIRYQDLPDKVRRHRRTGIILRICQKYDKKYGAGACSRLEIQDTGTLTLKDHSRGRKRFKLSQKDIDLVHSTALPALEDCVLSAARKDREFYRETEIRIGWVITPLGRAINSEIEPGRYKKDLAACVDERLGWFRYPKTKSRERKSVMVPYRLE